MEAHRRDDRLTHRPTTRQLGRVDVAMGDDLLADPLHLLADQRTGPILADVEEGDRAVRAHGVVRELLAVDELLHTDLIDVAKTWEDGVELDPVADAVSIQ